MIHRRTHPNLDQPGCFGCKVSSVRIAPSATPSRSPRSGRGPQEHLSSILAREKRWDTDMPAYKRLVDDGVQPPRIDGSADLEARCTIRDQVETGHPEWSESTISAFEETFEHGIRETPGIGDQATAAA